MFTSLMNKKSKLTFYTFLALSAFMAGELMYLAKFQTISEASLKKKNSFVQITALPDLAFGSKECVLRHRSLGTVFEIYKDAPVLRESHASSFVISHFKHTKSAYAE
jgi:hypothetical protein